MTTTASASLIARPDTLLGVCEGIGEDFGFNANILRVALAVMLFWSVPVTIGAYLALGLAVLASRLLFPKPTAVVAAHAVETPEAHNDDGMLPTAEAA